MKVFVGHSFKDEDREIVSKIKDFIESCGFECKTGEKSQNTSVAQKVKERICECDIFIGIFTRDKKIDSGFWSKKEEYTTSSWVIQESGYALAKCSHVIFLFEEKLDTTLGLQSDVEYISFDREKSLEDTINKLIQMFKKIEQEKCCGNFAIANKQDHEGKEAQQVSKEPTTSREKLESTDEKTELIVNIHYFAAIENFKEMTNSYEKVRPLLSDEKEKLHIEALYLKSAQKAGRSDSIEKLKKLVEHNPEDTIVLDYLAEYYESMQEFSKAKDLRTKILEIYKTECAECAKSNIDYAYYRLQSCIAADNAYEETMVNLVNYFNKEVAEPDKAKFLKLLTELTLKYEDHDRFFIFGEHYLSLVPEDTDIRFNVAYRYSENSNDRLSLYHYKKIIANTKNSTALNNISILYGKFKMDSLAISCLNEAVECRDTLYMSNLANKYIDSGFLKDAKNIIDKAISSTSEGIKLSENIGVSQSRLRRVKDRDIKSENDLLNEIAEEKNFLTEYSINYCNNEEIDLALLSGKWKTHWGDVEFNFRDKDFSFEFKIDIKGERDYTLVKLEGCIEGNTFNYSCIKNCISNEGSHLTRLGSILTSGLGGPRSARGNAIFDSQNRVIKVLEVDPEKNINFYTWQLLDA